MSIKLEDIPLENVWEYKICKDCKEIVYKTRHFIPAQDNPKMILTYCEKCYEEEEKRKKERQREETIRINKKILEDMKEYLSQA